MLRIREVLLAGGGEGAGMEHSGEVAEDKNKGRKPGHFCFFLTPEVGVWWSSTGLCWVDGWGWQRPGGTHSQGSQGRQSHWQE